MMYTVWLAAPTFNAVEGDTCEVLPYHTVYHFHDHRWVNKSLMEDTAPAPAPKKRRTSNGRRSKKEAEEKL